MAKNETRRIRPDILTQDRQALAALQAMSDYTPVNPAYTAAAAAEKLEAMEAARAAEAQAQAALDAARDNAATAEWEFHNTILGIKDQVIAQYGKDSNQVQALGLKKKSERKPRTRRAE